MNFSKKRELVLKALKDNVVHPSAEYIHSVLQKEKINMGLATVYRNLNQMSELGIIKKIDGLESSSHFDHNVHEHYHFMCNKCHRIYDVSSDVAPELAKKVENELGATVTDYDIILHGICSNCSKGEENG